MLDSTKPTKTRVKKNAEETPVNKSWSLCFLVTFAISPSVTQDEITRIVE
jgi:hypothetical protein